MYVLSETVESVRAACIQILCIVLISDVLIPQSKVCLDCVPRSEHVLSDGIVSRLPHDLAAVDIHITISFIRDKVGNHQANGTLQILWEE